MTRTAACRSRLIRRAGDYPEELSAHTNTGIQMSPTVHGRANDVTQARLAPAASIPATSQDQLPQDQCVALPEIDISRAIYVPSSSPFIPSELPICPPSEAFANSPAVIGQSITASNYGLFDSILNLISLLFGRKGAKRHTRPHFNSSTAAFGGQDTHKLTFEEEYPWIENDHSGAKETKLGHIPQYVLDYAPYVYLFSGEQFWPCDLVTHLNYTTPYHDYEEITNPPNPLNLSTLHKLNYWRPVFLHSNDNVEDRPAWLSGKVNIPAQTDEWRQEAERLRTKTPYRELLAYNTSMPLEDWADAGTDNVEGFDSDDDSMAGDDDYKNLPSSELLAKLLATKGSSLASFSSGSALQGNGTPGRSNAPATLIVVPKPKGIVDAFWFFFYSFNLGNTVFNIRFGNHVGDWEHTMVRFVNGTPKAVFFSEHSWGKALAWDAVEKIGNRPVTYSATGTHAMYPDPGIQSYILPWGWLHDETDRGPLWDPLLNVHSYTFNFLTREILSSDLTPKSPKEWLFFSGRWGDKIYPLSDSRQYSFLGQSHYDSGPTGPRWKNLGRKTVCQNDASCPIQTWAEDGDLPLEPIPVHFDDRPNSREDL